jgi:hypothetical protein
MSQSAFPPPTNPVPGSSVQHPAPTPLPHLPSHSPPLTVTGEIANVVKKLDPNMLSVLLLTVTLNSLFFYVYVEVARTRHVEFLAALNSCPMRGPSSFPPTP